MQRITAYIKQVFGEEVLAEIVSQKRTVSLNGIILDATAKNFRDKRVTPTSKVEVSDATGNVSPERLKQIIEENAAEVVTEQVTEVVTEEVPTEISTPLDAEVGTKFRIKRHYARLKIDKSIPEGAIIHTSKSGRQFYLKVIGKKEYI